MYLCTYLFIYLQYPNSGGNPRNINPVVFFGGLCRRTNKQRANKYKAPNRDSPPFQQTTSQRWAEGRGQAGLEVFGFLTPMVMRAGCFVLACVMVEASVVEVMGSSRGVTWQSQKGCSRRNGVRFKGPTPTPCPNPQPLPPSFIINSIGAFLMVFVD
jgi:hypothetical protein